MLNIIPVVGPFALLVINVFGGHPGPNAYGPDQETATACTSGRRSNRETRRARRPLKLVATLIGVVMLVAGGVQYLWSTHGKEIVAAGQASFEEGRRAGMALHESDCLAEALARHGNGSSSSLGASVSNSVRLSGCLRASSADIAFCLAVPPSIEILAVARWLNTSCARQQFSDPLCQNLFQAVVRYCESPERADKLKRGGMPRKIDA